MSERAHRSTPLDRTTLLAIAGLVLVVGFFNRGSLDKWFFNSDDWMHLTAAHSFISGEFDFFLKAAFPNEAVGFLRPVAYLVWVLDLLVHGYNAAGFYLTNLLIHVCGTAAVALLAARLGSGPAGAVLAGALYGFNASINQGLSYLSAREDQLCALLFVAAVLWWASQEDGPRRSVGAAILYVLALFSKTPAAVLPVVLVAYDVILGAGREELRPRRLLRAYWPLAVGALSYLVALHFAVGFSNILSSTGSASEGRVGVLEFLSNALSPWLSNGTDPMGGGKAWLPLPMLALPVLALTFGPRPWRPLLFCLAWWVIDMVIPAPFLFGAEWRVNNQARYVTLPTIGLSLAAGLTLTAASVRSWKWQAGTWALVVVLIAGITTTHVKNSPGRAVGVELSDLVEVARAETADMPEDGRLVVTLSRPDFGLAALLSSPIFAEMVGGLSQRPLVIREGGSAAYSGSPGQDAKLRPALTEAMPTFSLDDLDLSDSDRVLAGGWVDVGDRRACMFRRVESLPPLRAPDAPLPSFDFQGNTNDFVFAFTRARGGGQTMSAETSATEAGLKVNSTWRMPPTRMDVFLAFDSPLPVLMSTPVNIEPATACGLDLDMTVRETNPSMHENRGLPPGGPQGVLGWSAGDGPGANYEDLLLFPVEADGLRRTVHIELSNSVVWRRSPTVRRIDLIPMTYPFSGLIHSMRFTACEER